MFPFFTSSAFWNYGCEHFYLLRGVLPWPTLFRDPMSGRMPDDLPVRAVIVDFLRLVRLDIFCVALGTLVIAHAVPLVGPFGPAVNVIIQESHGWLLSLDC
jgi:hypothetical protein